MFKLKINLFRAQELESTALEPERSLILSLKSLNILLTIILGFLTRVRSLEYLVSLFAVGL